MYSATNAHYQPNSRRKMEFSRHAARRAQQRAISTDCVPLVLAYGERSHDGQGGVRYLMTDRSLVSLGRAVGRTQRTDNLAGVYVVVSADDEQAVITIGHRFA